jgi:hypothetical protein
VLAEFSGKKLSPRFPGVAANGVAKFMRDRSASNSFHGAANLRTSSLARIGSGSKRASSKNACRTAALRYIC